MWNRFGKAGLLVLPFLMLATSAQADDGVQERRPSNLNPAGGGTTDTQSQEVLATVEQKKAAFIVAQKEFKLMNDQVARLETKLFGQTEGAHLTAVQEKLAEMRALIRKVGNDGMITNAERAAVREGMRNLQMDLGEVAFGYREEAPEPNPPSASAATAAGYGEPSGMSLEVSRDYWNDRSTATGWDNNAGEVDNATISYGEKSDQRGNSVIIESAMPAR